MYDNLAMPNAVCEAISTPEVPLTGNDWSPDTLSDQTTCTDAGTNPQIAISDPLLLSPSFGTEFFSDKPSPWAAALFSSSSWTPCGSSTHRPRKARSKDLENLKAWQVDDLFRADTIANNVALVMDWFITHSWLHTCVGSGDFAEAFQRGCHRMVQWFRQRGLPPVYIYVHENPHGTQPNTHMLVHVPKALIKPFMALVGGWFGAMDNTAVKVQPRIQPGYKLPDRLRYMIKGAHYLVCKAYGGHRKKGGQGPIEFKRSGVCRYLRNEFGGRYDTWGGPIYKEAPKVKMLMSGDELKTLRSQSGLSQTELAGLAGLHRNSVNRLENTDLIRRTSADAVRRIMKALGVQTPEAYRGG